MHGAGRGVLEQLAADADELRDDLLLALLALAVAVLAPGQDDSPEADEGRDGAVDPEVDREHVGAPADRLGAEGRAAHAAPDRLGLADQPDARPGRR